jgi:hemoglobin
MKEIDTFEDIQLLVDTFYDRIREDELLGEIFNNAIQDRWPEHLEKMYRFWQTVLLKDHTYHGSPFVPHANLPIRSQHFERWKEIFNTTLDEYFVGETVEEAKWRSSQMAQMFLSKIEYYQGNPQVKVL